MLRRELSNGKGDLRSWNKHKKKRVETRWGIFHCALVSPLRGEEELLIKISWKIVTQRMYATVIPSNSRTATQINAKLSIWNRVVFPFGAQRREEKGGKSLEMDLTSSGEGIYRDAPFPKITRAELLPDGKRDELRDFPRGSNRKSVFWWLEFDRPTDRTPIKKEKTLAELS